MERCLGRLSVNLIVELHDRHDEEHVSGARHQTIIHLEDPDRVSILSLSYLKSTWWVDKRRHVLCQIILKRFVRENSHADDAGLLDQCLVDVNTRLAQEPFLVV